VLISCRRATELTSQELDTELSFHRRFVLGAHRFVCGACRRFRKQLVNIDRALEEFLNETTGPADVQMPDESKIRIREVLKSATSDDDANPIAY
jgi:predicted anti-sigma-YlaC factor YlaD